MASKAFTGRGTAFIVFDFLGQHPREVAEVVEIIIGKEITVRCNYVPGDPGQQYVLEAIQQGFTLRSKLLLTNAEETDFYWSAPVSGGARIPPGVAEFTFSFPPEPWTEYHVLIDSVRSR